MAQQFSMKLFWGYLAVLIVVIGLGGSLLSSDKALKEQVELRSSQTRGEAKPTNEPWLFSPYIVDSVCLPGETKVTLHARTSDLQGEARESYRFYVPGPATATVTFAMADDKRQPRTMLYNDRNQPIAAGRSMTIPEAGLYRLQSEFLYQDVLRVELAISARGTSSYESFVRERTKSIHISLDPEQLAVIERMKADQKAALAKSKDSAMRGVSLPSPKGRAMGRVKGGDGEWALATIGMAGRAHAHLTQNALPSLDVRITAGRLPYGLQRFKLYGLQAKGHGRDMVLESLLEDVGQFMPREDLILVTLNGKYMAFTQLLERIDTHAFEYARVLEQQVIGYDTDGIAATANESRFEPRGFYRLKSYPLSNYPDPSDPVFAERLSQLQMAMATSYAMTYTGNHGLNQSDLRFHMNTRTNSIAPMVRDYNSGVGPITFGYRDPTPLFFATLRHLATMAPNWRPSMPSHASYFVLRQGEQEQNTPFYWWTVCPQTLYWFMNSANHQQFCAGLDYWEQGWNRQRVTARLNNFVRATTVFSELKGQIDRRPPVVTQDSLNAEVFAQAISYRSSIEKDAGMAYLASMLGDVSGGKVQPDAHSLAMFKWRNKTLHAMINRKLQSMPTEQRAKVGIVGQAPGRVITFLHRQEEAGHSHLVFVQRGIPGFPGQAAEFSLVDDTGRSYTPVATKTYGKRVIPLTHSSLYMNDVAENEQVRLYYFEIPRQDTYRYLVSKCVSGGAYLGPVEICIDPIHQPEVASPEILGLAALNTGEVIDGPVLIARDETWQIDRPMTVHFGPKGYMRVEGKVAIADSATLTLTGEAGWGGIHFHDNADFALERLTVENVGGNSDTFVAVDGTIYTGAVTFFNTNVTLRDVHLKHVAIEDGLHFLRCSAVLDNVSVTETRGDAIDADYCQVEVSKLRIERAGVLGVDGGDGLDVSGSLVNVRDSVFNACTDKNLSIGENANVTVRNCEFRNAPMGVAAKDASRLDIDNCVFDGNETGIAVYIKKPFYPQPTVVKGPGVTVGLTNLGYRPE